MEPDKLLTIARECGLVEQVYGRWWIGQYEAPTLARFAAHIQAQHHTHNCEQARKEGANKERTAILQIVELLDTPERRAIANKIRERIDKR